MATLKECETEQGRHERMSASIAKVETKPGNPVLYMAAGLRRMHQHTGLQAVPLASRIGGGILVGVERAYDRPLDAVPQPQPIAETRQLAVRVSHFASYSVARRLSSASSWV